MKTIASFTVDHDKIEPGMYVSRIDGDIYTFDLRTRKPNSGAYMDNRTMHSVEHMMATFLRNSQAADRIIYFGPMGCQTGFYLLVRDADNAETLEVLTDALEKTLTAPEMYGQSRIECGNYKNLSLEAAKVECERYLNILRSKENDFQYK